MQPFDLRTAVNRRSWTWLLDLPQRLRIAIEIVDDQQAPVLPADPDREAVAIRQLLAEATPSLRSAISHAAHTGLSQAVAVDGHECVCVGLAPAGVLILARELGREGESVDQCRRDLESIGSWLGGAIEANLAGTPSDAGAEQHRIESLQRLLDEAASRGSMRDVVSAFAEALSVWHDIEVRGYVAGARGGFFQDVLIVGADPSAAPAELDVAVPADAAMLRLSREEAKTLGFASEGPDVLIGRVDADNGATWLMVFEGSKADASLVVDADLLRESLSVLASAATASLASGIVRHLLSLEEPAEAQAQLALDDVVAAVRAAEGALIVTSAAGMQALAIGNPELLPSFERRAPPDQLVVTAEVDGDGGLLALVVARKDGRFTAYDRSMLEGAAGIIASWVRGALDRFGRGERRGAGLPVHELIERLASETVQAGNPASVIMMSIPDTALRPGLMHAWVARVRGQLRPWDFAGVISGREVAVLLRDTPAEQAVGVSKRLRGLLDTDQITDASLLPSIGVVTCAAGVPISGSVVGAAREEAARRGREIRAAAPEDS